LAYRAGRSQYADIFHNGLPHSSTNPQGISKGAVSRGARQPWERRPTACQSHGESGESSNLEGWKRAPPGAEGAVSRAACARYNLPLR
jgi:hypothetical protein